MGELRRAVASMQGGLVYYTAVLPERGLYVVTSWLPERAGADERWEARTRIWDLSQDTAEPAWEQRYAGAVSKGGLGEAHAATVARARAGSLPAQRRTSQVRDA